MGNELSTRFRFDDRDGVKVDALRGKLIELNNLLNRSTNNQNFGKNVSSQFEQVEAKSESLRKSILDLNSAYSAAFGAAFVGGAIIAGVNTAITKSNEATRANRLLASSATEAGLAYDVLADKNRKVAETFGLSNVAAAQVTAKIQQLATFAGNPAQFDVLQKRFADLAAAKGIDSADLNVLIGTILSGQDEGLNRLGISDPGQLYIAYAKEIGKTADTLNQFEKVQAAVNAVVSKGAIFDGSAEARMNSLEGATSKAAASYDNLTTSLSQTVTNNLFFQNSIDLINKGLLQMSFNIDEVRNKLKNGLTPEEIAREEMRGFGNQLLGGATVAGNLFAGLPFLAYDLYDKPIGEAFDYYRNGIDPARFMPMLVNQRADQIRNQQKLDASQEKDANQEKTKTAQRNLISSFQSRIDALLKPASDGVSKAKIAVEDLNALERDFSKTINTFGAKDNVLRSLGFGQLADKLGINPQTDKLREGLETIRRKFLSERATAAEKRFSRNPTIEDAQFNLTALNSIQKSLPEEQFESFSDKLNDFIRDETKKINDKIKDLSKTYGDAFSTLNQKANSENPFVTVFSEADKALRDLRENLKGLKPELQEQAIALQQTINRRNLINATFDNRLSAFDLREQANNFRNPFDSNKQKLEEDQFIKRFLFENPNYLFLKRQEYDQRNLVGGLQSFTSFEEEIRKDILDRGKSAIDSPANRLNKSLSERANLLYNPRQSEEEQAIADRKFIALTNGINALDLNNENRERAAIARERQAKATEDFQRDALAIEREKLSVQKEIDDNGKRLLEIAEREGFNKAFVEIIDKTDGGAKISKSASRATPTDTQQKFNPSTVVDKKRGRLTNI